MMRVSCVVLALALLGCGDNLAAGGPDELVVDHAAVTLHVGESSEVTAMLREDGAAVTGGTVTWSSSNPATATVHGDGDRASILGAAAGTATITASSGDLVASLDITVSPALLTGIAIVPATPSLPAGTTIELAVIATFGDGLTRDVTAQVAWTSLAPAIATVVDHRLTGVARGDTTITASYQGQYSSTRVFVTAPPATLTAITVAPVTDIAVTAEQPFTATGSFSDSTTRDVTAIVTWSSSDPAVATIAPGGVALALTVGATTITAASAGITGSVTVDVVLPTVGPWVAAPGFTGTPCHDGVKFSMASDLAYVCTLANGVARGTVGADTAIAWASPNTGVTSLQGLAIAAHTVAASTMMYMSAPSGTDNNWFRSNDGATTFAPAALLDSAGQGRYLYAGRLQPMIGNILGTWDPGPVGGASQAIVLTGNGGAPSTVRVVGTVTGSVRSIAASAANNLYVAVLGETPAGAVATGGVFRSTSTGATWTETDTGIASADRDQITSVVIDPVTPTTLYVGIRGGARVYKTTDAGATWTASGTGLPARARVAVLHISPTDATLLYAATDRGLYTSSDSGAHWTLAGFQGRAVRGVAQSSASAALVLVGVDDAVGLYRPE